MQAKLKRFTKDLDDEAFYRRCADEIRMAIECDTKSIIIDLDWWKPGLKQLCADDRSPFLLFSVPMGLLSKRISGIQDRLETQFKSPGLKFSAQRGVITCRIKDSRTPTVSTGAVCCSSGSTACSCHSQAIETST